MPKFRVGARGEGAVSALLSIVQERKAERKDREKELRDWNYEMWKRGLKIAFEDRTLEPEYDANNYFTGRFKKAAEQPAFDPSTLRKGEKVELNLKNRIEKRTFQIPEFMTQEEYQAGFAPSPPPTIPLSPKPPQSGVMDFLQSLATRAAGGTLPGFGGFPVQRPQPAAARPRPVAPRPPVAPPSQVDMTQLLSDITTALQEGFTSEEISERLRGLGLDDATIEQLLQTAGA